MLKSEFCQLASLAVPQLLHALSLSHGADIFWNLINSNFNNKDWKIRFEAGQVCCNLELIIWTDTELPPTASAAIDTDWVKHTGEKDLRLFLRL